MLNLGNTVDCKAHGHCQEGKLQNNVCGVRCRLDGVMYDAAAAQQLEATIAEETVHVQRCKERVDDLASHLAGACLTRLPFPHVDVERRKASVTICKHELGFMLTMVLCT